MSDALLVALVAAALVFGHTLTLYGAHVANDKRDKIILGLVDGVPLSKEHRWLMLSNDWVPIKFSLTGYTALMTTVMIYLSQYTSNRSIEILAYLSAGFFAFAFLAFLFLGFSDFLLCIKSVRASPGK
jgi:hypothetical protein